MTQVPHHQAALLTPSSVPASTELGDVSRYLRDRIRTVPNWPQPGVMFRDITPLLQDPKSLRVLVDVFIHRYMGQGLNLVAGIDARGFILGSIVAYELNLGFVPIRKKGKLPFTTVGGCWHDRIEKFNTEDPPANETVRVKLIVVPQTNEDEVLTWNGIVFTPVAASVVSG